MLASIPSFKPGDPSDVIRRIALRTGRLTSIYRRLCRPSGREWAEWLRRHGGLYHLGEECSILPSAQLIDPQYTWIGDRVCLGNCKIICHDGSIEMLQQRYGVRLDRVAPVVIGDDCFVGEGAILLGGTVLGAGSIVGAGAVVRHEVKPGSVVACTPAKTMVSIEDVLRIWEAQSSVLPWAHLIAEREGAYDATMEPELCRLRQQHFFKDFPK